MLNTVGRAGQDIGQIRTTRSVSLLLETARLLPSAQLQVTGDLGIVLPENDWFCLGPRQSQCPLHQDLTRRACRWTPVRRFTLTLN